MGATAEPQNGKGWEGLLGLQKAEFLQKGLHPTGYRDRVVLWTQG